VLHSVESARQEWEEGYRRLQAEAHDRPRYHALMEQVDAIRDELRRRVGQSFTVAELARAYSEADSWIGETVAAQVPGAGWTRTLSLVEAAAFHLYARAATDYAP
jgi:hypothetical protein